MIGCCIAALDDANHQLASFSLYLEEVDDVDKDESQDAGDEDEDKE